MEAFDRLTALAVQMTDAPVAFITLVDAERSYWKSAAGLLREGPREDRLESSFSRHVLAADRTVVVPDASAPGRPRPVPDIDGAEVAAWMGVLCLGGHPAPLVLRSDGEVEPLGEAGTLIGVLDEPRLREAPFSLGRGDALVMFTDGVTEARRDGVQFGAEGLTEVLRECAGLDAEAIAARIERSVRDHAGSTATDDIALLVLRRSADGSSAR